MWRSLNSFSSSSPASHAPQHSAVVRSHSARVLARFHTERERRDGPQRLRGTQNNTMSPKGKSVEGESGLVVARRRRWEKRVMASGHWGCYRGAGNVLKLDYVSYKLLSLQKKNHRILHIKREDFMVCRLYLNKIVLFIYFKRFVH